MLDALRFLVVVEVVGLLAIPLAARLLGRLPGRGLGFAKPLGLLAAAYPVWLLAHLGVPFGLVSAVGGVVLLAVVGALIARPPATTFDRRLLRAVRRGPPDPLARRGLIVAEALFVLAFAGAALVRGFSPDVRGTEAPMDMAFLSAIGASDSFPPHDPWLAGESLNYYYLGHYLMAFVVRLSGVEPSVGYNLALAALFALSVVAAFALGCALAARRPLAAGLATAGAVCVAGTLDAATQLLTLDGPLRRYDWFAPSRAIPDAITEFPAFSFLLGDLHAHLLAVPFTLLALGFGLQAARARVGRAEAAGAGLAVGALYAINAWSLPVVAGVVALAPLLRRDGVRQAAAWSAGTLAVALVALAPFWLTYEPTPGGIGAVGEAARRSFTLFVRDQALLLGAFGWIVAAALLLRVGSRRTAAFGLIAALVVGSLLAVVDLAAAALLAALVAAAGRAAWQAGEAGERYTWLLVAAGLACVLGPELVYVRDEFDGTPLARMNTIFKLGFQAWILLAVAAIALLPLVRRRLPPQAWRVWAPLAVVALTATLAYPVAGTVGRSNGFAEAPRLTGMGWLAEEAPGDVGAIRWLRARAAGSAVVLEAVGDDYSAFGHTRISAFSGRPTVLGWPGHELQWGNDVGPRREDVAKLYRTLQTAEAIPLLRRYAVAYVVAGPLERADHGDDGLAKFDTIGRRVFDADGTTVWRMPAF